MRTRALAAVLGVCCAASTLAAEKVSEQPFAPGGRIELWLDAGEFEVKAARDNRIRVTLTSRVGDTRIELTANGAQGKVVLRNAPRIGFEAVIEVPKRSDLMIRMTAGDLDVSGITGSKDIESLAGDVRIEVGGVENYASVDASVKIGSLAAGPFGAKNEGRFGESINWTGKGKYTLRARLLAGGDLKLE